MGIKIWNFINSKIFVILIIAGLIAANAWQYSKNSEAKRQEIINNQNRLALTDSLKIEKNKNGESMTTIAGYIASEKQLRSINKGLSEQVDAQKGDVISLNNAVIRLTLENKELKKYLNEKETIIGELIKVDSNNFVAPWTLSYKYDSVNYDKFSGLTHIGVKGKIFKHLNTEMIKRETQIEVTFGQTVVDKKVLRVFIMSKYPGFSVKSMEGVLIDPNTNPLIKSLMKKPHWFTGFGVGPSVNLGWDVAHARPTLVTGVSFHYNIYQW